MGNLDGVRLIATKDASRLTGLSLDQLREWCTRRALIPADVKPKGHGSPARYSWQTILLLRIARMLREHFKVELQSHGPLFASLRTGLRGISFITLWGKSLALYGGDRWKLVGTGEPLEPKDGTAILIRLDPHLEILSAEFALTDPSAAIGQLQLFPAQIVQARRKSAGRAANDQGNRRNKLSRRGKLA